MKLKSRPEDFIVREVSTFTPDPRGKFFVYELEKRSLATLEALGRIAKHAGLRASELSASGLKDKHALTSQLFSSPCALPGDFADERMRLKLVGKNIAEVKLLCSGAGAAALSCLDILVKLGLPVANIWVSDIEGVVYEGRNTLMDPWKERYARATDKRSLGEIIDGADIFLGLSAGGVLKRDMVARMARRPLILALANPNPEIMPEDVKAVAVPRAGRYRFMCYVAIERMIEGEAKQAADEARTNAELEANAVEQARVQAELDESSRAAALEAVVDLHTFDPAELERAARVAGATGVRAVTEELTAAIFGWPVRTFEAAVPPGRLGLRWATFAYRSWQRLSWLDAKVLAPVVPRRLFYNVLLTGTKP